MKRHVILFGCGGHSRSVTDVLLSTDPEISILYVDENARDNETLYGFSIVKECHATDIRECFIAIGDAFKRKVIYDQIKAANLIKIISHKAHLGYQSKIEKGVFVGHHAHIGPESVIGVNSIVNTGAIVEHEVEVGEYSHIGPNASISGRCKIGSHVFVGVGATVKDYIKICSNVTIGAGATVVRDITEPGVYVGSPARWIK